MKNIVLPNEYKNSFVQNETINDILSAYIENIIIKNFSNEIINDYQMKKEYINSQTYNDENLDKIDDSKFINQL